MPEGLANITANRRCQHFKSLYITIGVNNESTPCFNTSVIIIYAVYFTNTSVLVRQHRKGDVLIKHLRQLIIIPHLMNVNTVNTNRQHLYAQALEFCVFFSNC